MKFMRLTFAMLLCPVQMAYASEMTSYEGSVTTFDNVTVSGLLYAFAKADRSEKQSLPEQINVRLKNAAGEEQTYQIETSSIDKVIYSGKRLGTCSNNPRTAQIVVLKNGNHIEQTSCNALLMPEGYIYVSSRHPITGGLSYDEIPWNKVKELKFGSNIGQVRRDSQGRLFPADYLFSPYTGERMSLVKIGQE